MLLLPHEAVLFFKLHRSLMCFVNERTQVVAGIDTPEQLAKLAPETRWQVRDALIKEPHLIELFVNANPFAFPDDELKIVSQWQHHLAGKFFIIRYLRNHAIFLVEDPPTAYGVLALTDPLESLVGGQLPIWVETVLLPFNDKIIYDGLVSTYRIIMGPGIRRTLNETYKAAKERGGIVTRLPLGAQPPEAPKIAKRIASNSTRLPLPDVLDAIVHMIDEFCRDHLNEEYSTMCRKLAEKLARKRPSPLVNGEPKTWAAGILRTIGYVNFLDDPEQTPHIKLKVIDRVLGTSESTSQQKSKLIRRTIKIQQFSPEWTLPSRVDDNPLIWMLEINGLIIDIRDCPRELQEVAFANGLIPYIPADRISAYPSESGDE